MAQVSIREYDAKRLLVAALDQEALDVSAYQAVLITPDHPMSDLVPQHPWLKTEHLVVKPDQVIGKRGKHKLILLNASYQEAANWIKQQTKPEIEIDGVTGHLTHFLVEPFVAHNIELYLAMTSQRDADVIAFSYSGGVDIEQHWDTVAELKIPILENVDIVAIRELITSRPSSPDATSSTPLAPEQIDQLVDYIYNVYQIFVRDNFTFLEMNPITIVQGKIIPLDAVARLDNTASFVSGATWGNIEFPIPFGQDMLPEEYYIKELDKKTGASLKLTVLNPAGRIWTLVAGGGASVIYADTVSDLGFGKELANYGEYSGDPSTQETYAYTKTILSLMLSNPTPGKMLLIGGGIANFTDVANTFTGIIKALEEFQNKLQDQGVRIYVRRGGPNYQVGLDRMTQAGQRLGLPIAVYGPDTHMTRIVQLAIDDLTVL